jgi:hypothetical protein
MEESYLNNFDYSGYYPFMNEISDTNLPDIGKIKNVNKKYYLKYNYRFTISIIIFIICTIGYIMNHKGLLDITNPSKLNEKNENEINISQFLLSNETCKNIDLIKPEKITNYFGNIAEFKKFQIINNYLIGISLILSLSLLSIIYYINKSFLKENKEHKYLKIISFILGSILLLNEFIIFIIYLDLFMRLYDIIYFIETSISNKCIILLTWNYTTKVLKELIKIILILDLFKICNIQLIIYFIKKLIVLNNFFNYEEKEQSKDIHLINNENENDNDNEDNI